MDFWKGKILDMRQILSCQNKQIQLQEIYKIESDKVVVWGQIAKDFSHEQIIPVNNFKQDNSSWAFFDRVIDLLMTHDFCSDGRVVVPLSGELFIKKYHEICLLYDHFAEIRCLHIELKDICDYLSGFENTEYIPVILNNSDKCFVDENTVSCLHPQALSFSSEILRDPLCKLHSFCQSVASTYSIPLIFRDIVSSFQFDRFQEIGAKYFSRAI
jgi:hypothetical protein